MIGALFRTMGPFAPSPPPGAQPPPLWGDEEHLHELFGDRVEFGTLERDVLEVTAFERPGDYAEHFKARYDPTIAAQANARRNEREAEFEEALNAFCEQWNRGTPERARFEMQYLRGGYARPIRGSRRAAPPGRRATPQRGAVTRARRPA